MEAKPHYLAALVRKFREAHGWTQIQMAEKLGVTPTTVHRYETEKSRPSHAVLRKYVQHGALNAVMLDENSEYRKALEEDYYLDDEDRAFFAGKQYDAAGEKGRPLLNVAVIASLSPQEHDVLEAVLGLLHSRDKTAKRLLNCLLEPWLGTVERSDGKSIDDQDSK